MKSGHWFWFLLTIAVMIWYSSVTIYVAIKGTLDIRQMLRRLKEQHDKPDETGARR